MTESKGAAILLVEDNAALNAINREALEMEGYTVLVAETVRAAAAILQRAPVDVIVLDILLPDGSGLALCKRLRALKDIPILFLSALGEPAQRVEGLRAGGDDYLGKPYLIDELCARVAALLRRKRNPALPGVIGPVTIHYHAQRAFVNGKDIRLKPREFALLRLLVEREGRYIAPPELYREVWGAEGNGDLRTVYTHIFHLRKKLCGDDSPISIEHDRELGYVLFIASDCAFSNFNI